MGVSYRNKQNNLHHLIGKLEVMLPSTHNLEQFKCNDELKFTSLSTKVTHSIKCFIYMSTLMCPICLKVLPEFKTDVEWNDNSKKISTISKMIQHDDMNTD